MQKDFHYCVIKVLAMESGFSEEDAQMIAYASQYTDDAVEHFPLIIRDIPTDLNFCRINDDLFDPICTAHEGIQYLSSLIKKVQIEVYIAFHFCPALPYDGHGSYSYRCTPNGLIARHLIKKAMENIESARNAQNNDQNTKSLIQLGIALHTYADNWAHQKFSGRHSTRDNDIERIALFKEGHYEPIPFFDQITSGVSPDIGHAEASHFPDQSHLKWKYEHDSSGITYSRDNTSNFLEAACFIYDVLCTANNKLNDWKKISNNIKDCLSVPSDSIKEKFAKYQATFPQNRYNFNYNKDEWRQQSLRGESFEWINFDEGDYQEHIYDYNGDLKWFYFHMAAYEQRLFVKNNIRADLK